MSTVTAEEKAFDSDEESRQQRIASRPPLAQCFNLHDFESVAKQGMKKTAWAYYSSGANHEITLRENHSAYHKIWFHPPVLVDVEEVDSSTSMLGSKCEVPFYVTATALGSVRNGAVRPSWARTRTDDISSSRPVFS